jgi:putative FmdB family regulatory protein
MPTYAYGCDKCGVRFDRYQTYDDPPLTECPECGEEALRKLFTPVGVVFKGPGFYSTDHRSPSGQGSSRKSEDGESAGTESGSKDEKAKPGEETKSGSATAKPTE